MKSLLFSLLTLFFYSCENASEQSTSSSTVSEISLEEKKIAFSLMDTTVLDSTFSNSYDLEKPTRIIPLPGRLMEISGLSYHSSLKRLLAVHDEKGLIYFIHPENGELDKPVKFGKGGDYEGIELVGDKIYIVKSNGTLSVFNLEKQEAEEKIKTKLSLTNDVEGLGFLKNKNALLIACKGQGSIDKKEKLKKTKAIYLFDLEEMKFKKTPWLLVKDAQLVEKVERYFSKEKFSKKFIKKMKERAKAFSPSGIAVHPISQHIYILSSQGKLLVEFNAEKKLHALHFLDKKHAQPEGICFAPNGDLFISNEGRGLSAKVFVYESGL